MNKKEGSGSREKGFTLFRLGSLSIFFFLIDLGHLYRTLPIPFGYKSQLTVSSITRTTNSRQSDFNLLDCKKHGEERKGTVRSRIGW